MIDRTASPVTWHVIDVLCTTKQLDLWFVDDRCSLLFASGSCTINSGDLQLALPPRETLQKSETRATLNSIEGIEIFRPHPSIVRQDDLPDKGLRLLLVVCRVKDDSILPSDDDTHRLSWSTSALVANPSRHHDENQRRPRTQRCHCRRDRKVGTTPHPEAYATRRHGLESERVSGIGAVAGHGSVRIPRTDLSQQEPARTTDP